MTSAARAMLTNDLTMVASRCQGTRVEADDE